MLKLLTYILPLLLIISCSDEGKSKKSKSPYESMVYKGRQSEEVFIPSNDKEYISVIAFGSNNCQDSSQYFWQAVQMNKPDVWVWLGNAIDFHNDSSNFSYLYCSYQYQLDNDNYSAFLDSVPNLIGMYDEYEFGYPNSILADANLDYAKSQFLDFLYTPKSSLLRKRQGLYNSYSAGNEGKAVKLILLDTKFFNQNEKPSKNDDLLGSDQWQWLEEIIKSSKADLNIIASPYSFLDEETNSHSWAYYKQCYEKLMELVIYYKLKNPLFISGSEKSGEIRSKLISSKKIYEINSGALQRIDHTSIPDSLRNFSKKNNFGLIKINWEDFKPIITLQIKTLGNLTVKEEIYKLD